MFIEGFSLEACHTAQAERRSANTAMAPTSVAAAVAAERASSASPPFFALSPPNEMDSIASPPTPASADGPTPAIAGSLTPLVYAEDFFRRGTVVGRWRVGGAMTMSGCWRRHAAVGGGGRTRQSTLGGRWEEVGGGRVTKGGFEVVAVRGGSRCRRSAVHCASADHCYCDAGRCRLAARWRLRR